jgi:hypothetical protein
MGQKETKNGGDGNSTDPEEEMTGASNKNAETTPLLPNNSVHHQSQQRSSSNDSVVFRRSNSSIFRSTTASDSLRKVSNRILQSMSTSQREHAMTLGVGPAAFLIKDAVIGQQDAPYEGWYDPYNIVAENEFRNVVSVLCGRLLAMTWVRRTLCFLPNWLLFVLSFIEPPQWCRDSDLEIADNNLHDSLRDFGDCKVILGAYGVTADGNEMDQLYPNSNSMWVSVTQSMKIELACIFVVAFWMLLELGRDGMESRLFFYPGAKRVLHAFRCGLLACMLAGIVLENTTFNPFFRMSLLTSHLRNFQREVLVVLKMIPQIIYILAMLAIVVLFYAWFGVVLFYGTEQGDQTFPNLIEGIWTLWICITTANYPDVMMPSYNDNRLSAIFFVSFMVISFFYLMNLILAGVVNT